MDDIIVPDEFLGIKKKKDKEETMARIPDEFLRVADLNAGLEDFPTRTSYLKKLAKDIAPSAEELEKRGLIKKRK